MKKVKMLVSAAISLGLTALALAKSPAQEYVDSYKGRNDVPVPVEVVAPTVSSKYAGSVVKVTFTVEKDGKAHGLSTTAPDAELEGAVKEAVSKWQFSPVVRNGEAVPTRVVLPVHILAPSES